MAVESISGIENNYAVQGSAQSQSAGTQQASAESTAKTAENMAKVATETGAINADAHDQSAQFDETNRTNEQQSNSVVKEAVEKINEGFANHEALFGYHEGTNRVTIKIVDKDTKKVIKEVPAEKTLDLIEKAWEMAGILVDEKR